MGELLVLHTAVDGDAGFMALQAQTGAACHASMALKNKSHASNVYPCLNTSALTDTRNVYVLPQRTPPRQTKKKNHNFLIVEGL